MRKTIIKRYCDKCKREVDGEQYLLIGQKTDRSGKAINDGTTLDICETCYRIFMRWMNDVVEEETTSDKPSKDSEDDKSETKRAYKQYSDDEKLQFLEMFESGKSNAYISMVMGLTRAQVKTLCQWARKEKFERGILKKMGNPNLKNIEENEESVTVDENCYVIRA